MNTDERRVAELVRRAFRGVFLGNGIGLRQARGLDNYADSKTLAALRADDEKRDWSLIPFEDLHQFSGSLCFLDAEGMRFHLPDFLIASIEGSNEAIFFHLLHPDKRFELLSREQRQAVREVLLLRLHNLSESQRGFEGPLIEDALSTNWRE